MKTAIPPQVPIDNAIDKRSHAFWLEESDDPPAKNSHRALWLEEARRLKRRDGNKYFTSPAGVVVTSLPFFYSSAESADENLTSEMLEKKEIAVLEQKIRFLELQLESRMPYLQLYRLGAGSLFTATLSLVVWLITGTGIPFHPMFAVGVIPPGIGLMAMAFLIRPKRDVKR